MKKLLLAICACAMLASLASAAPTTRSMKKTLKKAPTTLNITDPLFMPAQNQLVLDAGIPLTNNALRLDKSWGIDVYGRYGVMDNFEIGLGWGWAKIDSSDGHDSANGFQDFIISAKYRFVNDTNEDYFFDGEFFLSPSTFDSIYNNEDGSAKGSTDFGLEGTLGTTKPAQNFTFAGKISYTRWSSTDLTSSANIFGLKGLAKYYLNDVSSFEGGLFINYYDTDENVTGIGISLTYAYEAIPNKFAVLPYWSAEDLNKNLNTQIKWGIKARYLF